MGQLSKARLRKFSDESKHFFDWMTVLHDAGITDVQDLQGQYLLKCPFHEDWAPSFRIKVNEGYYHCFSCNAFGTVVKLMYELSSKSVSEVQFYEQVLKRSPAMQSHLGFSSLFIDAYTLDEGFNGRRRFSARSHIGAVMPLSVLYQEVKKAGDSWENLVYSLTLLQEGERPDTIAGKIAKQSAVRDSKLTTSVAGVTGDSKAPKAKGVSLLSLLDLDDVE